MKNATKLTTFILSGVMATAMIGMIPVSASAEEISAPELLEKLNSNAFVDESMNILAYPCEDYESLAIFMGGNLYYFNAYDEGLIVTSSQSDGYDYTLAKENAGIVDFKLDEEGSISEMRITAGANVFTLSACGWTVSADMVVSMLNSTFYGTSESGNHVVMSDATFDFEEGDSVKITIDGTEKTYEIVQGIPVFSDELYVLVKGEEGYTSFNMEYEYDEKEYSDHATRVQYDGIELLPASEYDYMKWSVLDQIKGRLFMDEQNGKYVAYKDDALTVFSLTEICTTSAYSVDDIEFAPFTDKEGYDYSLKFADDCVLYVKNVEGDDFARISKVAYERGDLNGEATLLKDTVSGDEFFEIVNGKFEGKINETKVTFVGGESKIKLDLGGFNIYIKEFIAIAKVSDTELICLTKETIPLAVKVNAEGKAVEIEYGDYKMLPDEEITKPAENSVLMNATIVLLSVAIVLGIVNLGLFFFKKKN